MDDEMIITTPTDDVKEEATSAAESDYTHDEDGLPMQNGYAVLAHPTESKRDESEVPGDGVTDTQETDEADSQEESQDLINDPDNPLNEFTDYQIQQMLRSAQEMVKIMEQNWASTKSEFNITDGQIKELYKFNEDNRDQMPEGLSKEEQEKWDHFNGLDKLTEEDVERIFGAEHKIIGVMHSQTLDRVRSAVADFFGWTYSMRKYKDLHDAYLEFIEIEEAKNINELKIAAEQEEDPEKKKVMQDAVNMYYYRKNLEFLADPLDDRAKKRLADAWADERKIEYWIKRSADKLRRMKISNKIILEISKFEQRFLPEKYHRINNILLIYFLNNTTYASPDNKIDENRLKTVCMVFALDAIIQRRLKGEALDRIMNNIIAFEDQMLEWIPDLKAESDEDTSANSKGATLPWEDKKDN